MPLANIQTVFVIVMENHNWADVKGNPGAPFINNTLLPMGAHAEQYFNPPGIHPSLPNYLWMETATDFGIRSDGPPSQFGQNTPHHLVTQLTAAGISWKTYQEDIAGGGCPLTDHGKYAVRHNPFVYFADVTGPPGVCAAHVRPFSELAGDLQGSPLARYNFITPNKCSDGHDSCPPLNNPLRQIDNWLANHIPPILNSPSFQQNGAIFITWDEGEQNSDGPIGMIVLSPLAKAGFSNTIRYTHSSLLRSLQIIFSVGPFLGDAANSNDLSDLFL